MAEKVWEIPGLGSCRGQNVYTDRRLQLFLDIWDFMLHIYFLNVVYTCICCIVLSVNKDALTPTKSISSHNVSDCSTSSTTHIIWSKADSNTMIPIPLQYIPERTTGS